MKRDTIPPRQHDLGTMLHTLRSGSTPREVLQAVDGLPWLPDGTRERVHGWGLMGQPFESGHVLGLRRWSSTSIGPAYTAVWHRTPGGRWTFVSDQDPAVSCNRYAGEQVDDTATTAIHVTWRDDHRFDVLVPELDLRWEVRLAETATTRLLNAIAQRLPDRIRRNSNVLRETSQDQCSRCATSPTPILRRPIPPSQRWI